MAHTIIFNISGGAGKNIIATAVIESIHAEYPDSEIIISSPWSDVWQNNPLISKVVAIGKTPHFYEEYIYNKEVTLFFLDPYNDTEFIHRREHIMETWCRICEVPCITKVPRLYFTEKENEEVRKKLYASVSEVDAEKPLFFIQPSGGATNQPYPISWARDLPLKTAEAVVHAMNKEGYRTIHIRRKDQLPLPGTHWIECTLREVLCAVQYSEKRLFVDSLAAHVAGALNLNTVVVWVTNNPKVFGYPTHTHIEAFEQQASTIEFRHNTNAYIDAYNIAGVWDEHPFVDDALFDADDIVQKLLGK